MSDPQNTLPSGAVDENIKGTTYFTFGGAYYQPFYGGSERDIRRRGEAGLGGDMNRSRLWAAVLVVMLGLTAPVVSEAKTPGRNGNESDFKDWQPSRGQVSTEESAAGVAQTPAQRKSEDRELQQLYNSLLRQEPVQPPK